MFAEGDVIDEKYTVEGTCSSSGGMGVILFVKSNTESFSSPKVVLKYCRETDDESLNRFRRETRMLVAFAGNSKVAEILDHNLSHDPPYFVMPFYPKGDLTTLHSSIKNDLAAQESLFYQMIDCVAELHQKNQFHRDIKPQNFLRDSTGIRVSDLGLSTELNSLTQFTKSSSYWGTPGYLPPEFSNGGFKHADASGDVFMLGKSFYVLLTQRSAMYLIGNDIPPPLFHVIQKCCHLDKKQRYQTLAELKQSVAVVYDILLNRVDGVARAMQLLTTISTQLNQQSTYDPRNVNEFLDSLVRLPEEEKGEVAADIPRLFFQILTFPEYVDRVSEFLTQYRPLVEGHNYSWEYAETIADNMKQLFDSTSIGDADKASALDLAMHAAKAMNRFAAMATCQAMITSVESGSLAVLVRDVILRYPVDFVYSIEPVNCKNDIIGSEIREMKRNKDA
jgi:serine/threonine protein kinase